MTNFSQKEIDYIERISSTFIGQKVAEVYYEEINYGNDFEYWKFSENIHSVDMSITFKLENGKLFQIKWDNEFYCYGIGFEEINALKIKEGFKMINVSENKNWKSKILKNIISIDIYWDGAKIQSYKEIFNIMIPKGRREKIRIPLTWEISFEKEKLYVSAFEIKENGSNIYWTDHLTINFNEKELRKYKLEENACR